MGTVQFASPRVQRKAAARTSVLMRFGGGRGEVHVGLLQRFYECSAPRPVAELLQAGQTVHFAHVRWLRPQGRNAELLQAPQVSRDDHVGLPAGVFCPVQDLIPVNASLVPHNQQSSWWQVLHHSDCQFSRPQNTRPGV